MSSAGCDVYKKPRAACPRGTLTASAAALARHLRCGSRWYDGASDRWAIPELDLWWAVVETTIVEVGMMHSPDHGRRTRAAAALTAWRDRHAPLMEAVEDVGLSAEVVRRVVLRWARAIFPEAFEVRKQSGKHGK